MISLNLLKISSISAGTPLVSNLIGGLAPLRSATFLTGLRDRVLDDMSPVLFIFLLRLTLVTSVYRDCEDVWRVNLAVVDARELPGSDAVSEGGGSDGVCEGSSAALGAFDDRGGCRRRGDVPDSVISDIL